MARIRSRRATGLDVVTYDRGSGAAYSLNPGTLGTSYPVTREPEKDMWRIEAPGGSAPYIDVHTSDSYWDDPYDLSWKPAVTPYASNAEFYSATALGVQVPTSWANIHAASVDGFHGGTASGFGVSLRTAASGPGTPGLYAGLSRGFWRVPLGVVPLGAVVKSAQIIAYPWHIYGDGTPGAIPGAQAVWVISATPLANDGSFTGGGYKPPAAGDDWHTTGDTLDPPFSDLFDFDSRPAEASPGAQPAERPEPIVWNVTPSGLAYIQDQLDSGTPFFKAVQLKLLLEWDRADTEPSTWEDGVTLLQLSNGNYATADGVISPPVALRLFI